MFGKKTAAATEPTVIGQGAVIEGSLRVSGRVQVDGRIEGSLTVDGMVSVGPTGSVVGDVEADELAVGGRVEGNVTARKHLYVAATGAVCGELCYGSLQVERGAVLDGRSFKGEAKPAATPASKEVEKKAAPGAPPIANEVKKVSPPLPAGSETKVTTKVGFGAAAS
jgi:cytoskeletal protein CcmA (bactofilin family)